MLSNEEKEKIRQEEIYREEIRKTISRKDLSTKNRIMSTLNSPFTLWVLSSIVVGLVSFFYSESVKNQENDRIKNQKIDTFTSEARFRIRQIDIVLEEAMKMADECVGELAKNQGKIKGEKIQKFLYQSQRVTIALRLGGINYLPPQRDTESVGIGSAGYGVQSLPYGRGHKNPDFVNDTLYDLVVNIAYEKSDAPIPTDKTSDLRNVMNKLDNLSQYKHEAIVNDWFAREQGLGEFESKYGGAYKVLETDVDDYANNIKEITDWIASVNQEWSTFKKHELISNLLIEN